MAEQITLATLANLENETTATGVINNNNAIITSAFTDVLSLSGVQPNKMNSALDMNSFPIMNLPAPGSANSPARLVDVTSTNPITISLSLAGDVTAPASSGVLTTTVGHVNGVTYPASPSTNTVPVVTGSNTVAYQQITSSQIANNTIVASDIANSTITATQLANNTIGNAQIRQSTGLSIVGNTGTTTANVADITGTTRQVLAVNTAGTALTFAQPQGDQLKGTTTNDTASAGNIGEYQVSTVSVGSPVSLTTATPTTVTSLSLTAGDWDVWGEVYYTLASSTSITQMFSGLNTTGASINGIATGGWVNSQFASVTPNTATFGGYTAGPLRVSLSGTTTYFLVTQATFATSTCSAYGIIQARRVR
jgi:hypothetical protein